MRKADGVMRTLLEDGECDRGDQFKQGFDWGKVVRLAGKYMHHLVVTSKTKEI